MKVLLAGGGTGGHINPALAIASIIKKHDPSAEFLFCGNAQRHGGTSGAGGGVSDGNHACGRLSAEADAEKYSPEL